MIAGVIKGQIVRRLDELRTLEEYEASLLRKPMERRAFRVGNDRNGRQYQDLG